MTCAHYKGGHHPGNDLGLHYTDLPPIVASCPYSDQLLVSRKFWSPGANRLSQASPLGIVKSVDQCFCSFEIGSFETLGEPIGDRREKRNRLCGPMLVAQQPGEARGGAQFPGQGSLPVRPVERLPQVTLGRRRGFGRVLQQNELALDAQQLGDWPAFFGALGSQDRLLDRGEPVGNLPGPAPSLGHQKPKEPWDGSDRGGFGKGGAQQP